MSRKMFNLAGNLQNVEKKEYEINYITSYEKKKH